MLLIIRQWIIYSYRIHIERRIYQKILLDYLSLKISKSITGERVIKGKFIFKLVRLHFRKYIGHISYIVYISYIVIKSPLLKLIVRQDYSNKKIFR